MDPERFSNLVDQMTDADLHRYCDSSELLPSRNVVDSAMERLREVLFPGYFGPSEITREMRRYQIGATLESVTRDLQVQIERGLCYREIPSGTKRWQLAAELTDRFLERLVHIRDLLNTDVQAHYDGDPAASSLDETILSYPGILAISSYRVAHELFLLQVPLIPRMITEQAHRLTGIDIHPGATIGAGFFIDHGTGIVVGETCRIGKHVRVYQGVTLGARSFSLDENGNPMKGIDRHPIVEDDVIIYSGATILGRVTIGRGAVIGGNVWLTRDVPAAARITQATTVNGI